MGLIVALVIVLVFVNLLTIFALLSLRSRQHLQGVSATEASGNGNLLETPSGAAPSTVNAQPADDGSGNGTAELKINEGTENTVLSSQEIYEKINPSIAVVMAWKAERTDSAAAVVMTADGYLITNAHTVAEAQELQVQLQGGTTETAALVGIDHASDLAVLKIETEPLTPAEFGSSDALRVGDELLAVSAPFGGGMACTMTRGMLSSISQGVVISGKETCVLQTNATLDSDAAGGPLLNQSGQVVAIGVTQVGEYVSYQTVPNLGFALPVREVQEIVNELIANGYVSGRPSLGIEVSEIPEPQRLFLNLPQGLMIDTVYMGSSAYSAGLQATDFLIQIGDTEVTDLESYQRALNSYCAGDVVRVYIYRGSEILYADAVLDEAGLLG